MKALLALEDGRTFPCLSFTGPGEANGEVVFNDFKATRPSEVSGTNWPAVMNSFGKIRETEIVFEHGMFYILKTGSGYIVVVMDKSASIAMVRLNCSIIVPSLQQQVKKQSGLARFFRRKK